MGSSASRILFIALLAGGAAIAFAAHSKARSVKPLDASFHTGASGTIEASIDPPIQGILRIIVRTTASTGRPQHGGSADPHQPLTLEVTQWDRPVPFRLVNKIGRHDLVGGGPSLLVADIDVNDLTPGVPVRVRIHSNSTDLSVLEGRAYAIVY